MNKSTAQIFIISSMLLIIVAKTDLFPRILAINNLALKGTQK